MVNCLCCESFHKKGYEGKVSGMKKSPQRHYNNFISVVAVLLFIICFTGIIITITYYTTENHKINASKKSSSVQQEMCENNNERPAESEIPHALENFGKYLEEIYTEGRNTELDS